MRKRGVVVLFTVYSTGHIFQGKRDKRCVGFLCILPLLAYSNVRVKLLFRTRELATASRNISTLQHPLSLSVEGG